METKKKHVGSILTHTVLLFFYFYLMNTLSYLFYKPTARERIRTDQQGLNKSNFNYINETFKDLKHEMNVSLYDKLLRFRHHHEDVYRRRRLTPDFDFNLINRNYHFLLCKKLKDLLIGYNHEFVQLFQKYTFFNIFTESQRMNLFHTVIDDNDFVVYALFVLEKTHGVLSYCFV